MTSPANLRHAKEMVMAESIVYRSRARIERVKGPLRRAYLPALEDPIHFGIHSEIAEHYGVSPDVHKPVTATIDYLVAATAG
jgi:hypothetical protein